mmetsp:Transcript_8222/g.20725  ORF Transcript_8222/g.20725 Transcript_8222/m.20725 type:complete len:87 (+) Transcript_8222:113-373(+)|eukprot:CAMPEP_0117531800 /NCGR_PEP_ID=MMETSP0784-20121206/39044_1 /TAXON_ID=39447 /ORGANISM="" /LENGTH=86 /DNA_ID=CAMNT_0005328183 /DNA_START=108 /DNA_END=368 /DNA_ORIENTATION=+
MLDVITLFSAVNIQEELQQANQDGKKNLQELVVHEHDSGSEGSLVENAAEQLASAFDVFESALASVFTTAAPQAPPPAVAPIKKVA